jgi:hypothetical protein
LNKGGNVNWLRKKDVNTGRWTNQICAYNKELASEHGWLIVDEKEAKACQAEAIREKLAAAAAKRKSMEIAQKSVVPVLNTAESRPQPPKEPDPFPEEPEAEVESAVDVKPIAPAVEDDLAGKTRDELRAIVDSEGLDVKKNGTVEAMLADIRAARLAKQG